jgi:hypothetical protein
MTAAAENDPCDALAILRAIRRRVPGVSYRLLKIIWLLRQPGVCDEFRELSDLDANRNLRYDAFRGADSLEASASVFLPDGYLNFEDYSGGGFYLTALAAVCGVDVGVVEDGLGAFEKKSKAKKREKKSKAAATLTEDNDEILIEAAREGLEAARKRVANFPYSGIVGGEGRDHWTRYKEKAMSEQLFGRFGRELVRAAIAELDVESMSEDEIVAAVKTKLAVHNRVFMSEPLFIALAMEGGDAYHGEGWITAIARDVEGMAAGLTGCMIETGGLNVAHLGSEAKRVPGRTEAYTDGHLAFSFMRDIAFAEAKGGDAAAFDVAYERVKKLLAKDVFSRDQRMMQRLAETSVLLLEENGLDVLAKADAETWRLRRECPTYDTIDARTFARALAAGDGRKGGASTAKLVLDFKDPKVMQSPEDERKAKNVLMIDPTPAEKDAHAVAIVRGKLRKRGLLPQGPVLTDGNSAEVAEDNPAGAHRGDAPGSASDPAAPDHPAGDGARRGKRKRFNGKKKDPTSVRGARKFIELGVPLICSECKNEETSSWSASKADPKKPVCNSCQKRQVRRASHSLASIACILSALPVFVTDAYVMFLHSSPPPAATAPAARSPVRSRARCSSRGSRSAPGSARSAGTKKRPPTASAPRATRAWTRCRAQVSGTSRSASRASRGSATRATGERCAHPCPSHSSHANANVRRPPPRFVSRLTARRSRFPFFAANGNLDRCGDDVRQVRVVQGQQLEQLPGRAWGQGLRRVL